MSCSRACRSSVVVVPLMALRRFLSAFVARRTVALWCAQVLVGLEHTEGGARPRRGPAVVAVEVLQFTPLPHRRRPGAALEGDALAVFERHVGVEEGPPLGFPDGGVGEELELLSEVVAEAVDDGEGLPGGTDLRTGVPSVLDLVCWLRRSAWCLAQLRHAEEP